MRGGFKLVSIVAVWVFYHVFLLKDKKANYFLILKVGGGGKIGHATQNLVKSARVHTIIALL